MKWGFLTKLSQTCECRQDYTISNVPQLFLGCRHHICQNCIKAAYEKYKDRDSMSDTSWNVVICCPQCPPDKGTCFYCCNTRLTFEDFLGVHFVADYPYLHCLPPRPQKKDPQVELCDIMFECANVCKGCSMLFTVRNREIKMGCGTHTLCENCLYIAYGKVQNIRIALTCFLCKRPQDQSPGQDLMLPRRKCCRIPFFCHLQEELKDRYVALKETPATEQLELEDACNLFYYPQEQFDYCL